MVAAGSERHRLEVLRPVVLLSHLRVGLGCLRLGHLPGIARIAAARVRDRAHEELILLVHVQRVWSDGLTDLLKLAEHIDRLGRLLGH